MQSFKTHNLGGTDFFTSLRHMDAWDVYFNVQANPSKPVLVEFSFGCAVTHRIQEVTGTDAAIDFAMKAGLSGPKTSSDGFSTDPWTPYPVWVPGAVYASNILNRAQHYGVATFSTHALITAPGWYRAEIWAKSASDAAPGVNGLARVLIETATLNHLSVLVND